MIPIEKLKAVKTIIVHDNCSDGLMSAILLRDAYSQVGLNPELKFIQYGTDAYKTLEPTPDLMFCDFSPFVPEVEVEGRKVPDPAKLKPWADSGTIILDHHKGAKAVVMGLGENGVFGDEVAHPGVSGAMLAYREVWLPFYASDSRHAIEGAQAIQEFHEETIADPESEVFHAFDLATVAGIRDTWLNHHARWRESCILNEVLRFYPNEEWLGKVLPFHPGNRGFWTERLKLGDLLWTKHEKGIAKCIEKSWRFTSDRGNKVLVFEGVRSSSDVAEVVDKEVDLVMAFDYEAETPKDGGPTVRKIIYSTRSHTNFNCMEFCKGFGGGGHTKAAGFNVVFDREAPPNSLSRYAYTLNPYTLAETLVRMYEEKQQGT